MSEIKEKYIPSNKEKNNNKEKLTQSDIQKIKTIAEKSYDKVYADTDLWVEKAIQDLEENLSEFKKIIESKWITVNWNNFEDLVKNITSYFDNNWYIFKPWVTPVWNWKIWLSLSLYKKNSVREENLDNFELFWKVNEKVNINYVDTVIWSYQNYKWFINDWLTIMWKNWKNQVLIFPKNIKLLAEKQGIKDIDDYQESVEINELSQVYFSKFIPNNLLSVKLSDFIKVPDKSWNLHHVLEAYSDYETLRQWDFFDEEVNRIKNSKADNYKFSKKIMNSAIELYNQNIKEWDNTPLNKIILNSYKANIVWVVGAFNWYIEYMKEISKQKK